MFIQICTNALLDGSNYICYVCIWVGEEAPEREIDKCKETMAFGLRAYAISIQRRYIFNLNSGSQSGFFSLSFAHSRSLELIKKWKIEFVMCQYWIPDMRMNGGMWFLYQHRYRP